MRVFLVFLYLCSTISVAHAFRLTPMVQSFADKGREASQNFFVENNGAEKIAVQVSVTHRKMNKFGKEQRDDASSLFNIYPQQLTLKAGERKAIRVSWRGTKKLTTEMPFRFIAEQLGVSGLKKNAKKGAEIKILLRYVAALYVEPNGVKPKLVLSAVKTRKRKLKNKKTVKQLLVLLSNKGTKHQGIIQPKLSVVSQKNKKKKVILSGERLKVMDGQNVLAGSERVFVLDWPKEIPYGAVNAQFEFK